MVGLKKFFETISFTFAIKVFGFKKSRKELLKKSIKKGLSKRDLKLIQIKCFLVSTELNQFLLHTHLISH